MTKEEAKKQFDYHTKTLGLKHEFDFDEAWGWLEHQRAKKQGIAVVPSKEIVDQEYKYQFRENIMAFQDRVLAMENKPGVTLEREALDKQNPLKHTFCKDIYIREIYNPKGALIITKIHKTEHPFFLLKGDMSIATEKGNMRIKAPYYGITPAGTKRIIFTHEECVFVTIHANPKNERDIKKIEDEELIAKDFQEIEENEREFKRRAACL